MIVELERKGRPALWGGFCGTILGRILLTIGSNISSVPLSLFGFVVMLGCLGFFVWGCGIYAQAKGYSRNLGWLAFLSLIGILILALLPDRYKNGELALPGEMTPGTLPPPPYKYADPASTAITDEQTPPPPINSA